MEDDFDAWYAEVRPRLGAALASWCGDADVAADALDEAFVRAVERWDRVSHLDVPAGWVWLPATNVVRRGHRRLGSERQSLLRAGRRRTDDTTDDPTEARPGSLALRAALLALTDRQRTAIVLHYLVD